MSKKSYVAFVDLLATKQSLDIGYDKYYSLLSVFRQTIQASSERLDDDDSIYMFSDCAYIGFKRIDTFANFVNYLQRILMAQNIFFRCSVCEGDIGALNIRKEDDSGADINGYTFGENAVNAFLLHERFKGIGSIISENVKAPETEVVSYFFKTSHRSSLVAYRSFKLAFDNLDQEKELLLGFSREFMRQNTISKRIGRYYISLISLWISSTDFSNIEYDTENGMQTNKPIVDQILFNEKFFRMIIEIPGGETLIFFLFTKILSDAEEQTDILEYIAHRVDKRKTLKNQIGMISSSIMPDSTKRKLVEIIVPQ